MTSQKERRRTRGTSVARGGFAALCILVATAATAVDRTLYVAASANAGGVGGTQWRTDLEVHNRGAEQALVMVSLLVHGADNSAPRAETFIVDEGTSVRYEDALATLFQFEGTAALRVENTGGDLLVTSRTFNTGPEGTFGQFIPSVDATIAADQDEELRLIQLAHSADMGAGFRTNLGFVNTSASWLEIDVDLRAANGTLLGALPVVMDPFEYRQLTDVFRQVTDGSLADGYAVARTPTEGGRLLAYASVVDNRTGDPIYVPPLPSVSGEAHITAGASAEGVGGTRWRTDLQVHNPSPTAVRYAVALLISEQANPDPTSLTLAIGTDKSAGFTDILSTFFAHTGTGSLRITAADGGLMVSSRTYNLGEDGTYGQFIPGMDAAHAAGATDERRLIQLTHTADFRTNLGVVNASSASVTIDIDLYQAAGDRLGSVAVVLAPLEHRQLNGVFSQVTAEPVPAGYAIVTTPTTGGRYFTYASVVDNRTGDPIYIGGL